MNASLALLYIMALALNYPGREQKRKSSENSNYAQRYFFKKCFSNIMQCMSVLDQGVKYILSVGLSQCLKATDIGRFKNDDIIAPNLVPCCSLDCCLRRHPVTCVNTLSKIRLLPWQQRYSLGGLLVIDLVLALPQLLTSQAIQLLCPLKMEMIWDVVLSQSIKSGST